MNLRKLQLKVIDNEKCSYMTHFNVADSQICTLTHSGQGTCFVSAKLTFGSSLSTDFDQTLNYKMQLSTFSNLILMDNKLTFYILFCFD